MKPQLTTSSSEVIHGVKKMVQVEPKMAVSYSANKERKNDKKIAMVDRRQDPKIPIKRPKQIQEMKLKKGKMRIQKYIERRNFLVYN